MLGIDWAMIEIRDAFATLGKIDGEFTMANQEDAREFLAFLDSHVGNHIREQMAAGLKKLS